MYELRLAKSKFYRVKRGQSASDIENTLCMPVNREVREGMVIPIPREEFTMYRADVGDTYRTIAVRFCVEEEELRRVNGNRALYPACRVFIPR